MNYCPVYQTSRLSFWILSKAALGILNGFTALFIVLCLCLALIIIGQRIWIAKVKMKHKLNETSLQLLQRQLNQHFIFNSLNAINYHLLVDNNARASDLLSKFAKLLRYFLEASERESNSVERECRLLLLYLELEQIRFQNFFSFSIKCDQKAQALFIPSMIVYSVLESAIISQIQSPGRKFNVAVSFKAAMEKVTCYIEVDGLSSLTPENIFTAQKRLKLLTNSGQICFPRPASRTGDSIKTFVEIRF